MLAGRPRVARPFLDESFELTRSLAANQVTVVRTLAYLYLYFGDLAYAQGGDACVWYRRLVDHKAGIRDEAAMGFTQGPAAPLLARAAQRAESCGRGSRARD
jgi:hypothetical protein